MSFLVRKIIQMLVCVFILALLAFCSPAVLRDFEVSSNKESSTPIPRPIARTRNMPFMLWALRDKALALSGIQLLAHHLVRRYVSSPASLSCRMATLRFFSIGDPVPRRRLRHQTIHCRLNCSKKHQDVFYTPKKKVYT